jgi:hypothetical protein
MVLTDLETVDNSVEPLQSGETTTVEDVDEMWDAAVHPRSGECCIIAMTHTLSSFVNMPQAVVR